MTAPSTRLSVRIVLDTNVLVSAVRHEEPATSPAAGRQAGEAICPWHGLAGKGRLPWWAKNRIDRAFVRRYQAG